MSLRTYIESSTQPDDHNLKIAGYKMALAVYPINNKTKKILYLLWNMFTLKGPQYIIFKWMYKVWIEDWRWDK